MKVTKKLWAWLLCLTMITVFIPNITFADDDPQWTYYVYLTAADVNDAGTGDSLYVKLWYTGSNYIQKTIGGVSRGQKTETKTISTNIAPWQLTGLTVVNPGNNAVCISSVYLGVKDSTKSVYRSPTKLATFSGDNTWIESENGSKHKAFKGWTYSAPSELTTKIDNIATNLSGTTILDVSQNQSTDTFSVTWDGKVSDQHLSNYNIFDYGAAPETSVNVSVGKGASVSQTGTAYKTYSASDLGITTYTGLSDSKVGFKIDSKAALLKKMNDLEVNYITITSQISFESGRTSENTSSKRTITRTYTFVRNVFDIGTPTFSTNYSKPNITDYYYYNTDNEAESNGITVTIPILYGSGNFSHLNCDVYAPYTVRQTYVYYNAKLEVNDGNKTSYIYCDSSGSRTDRQGNLVLYFPIDGEYSSGVNGLALILTDVKTSMRLSSSSSTEYKSFYLHQTGKALTGSDTTYTLGNTYYYSGKNKVDTIRPTVEYTVADNSAGKLGEWSKTLTLSSQASENMYVLTDTKFTSPVYEYSLVSGTGDNKTAVKIYDKNGYTGAKTIQQASASGSLASTIVLALAEQTEGEYTLEVYGKDMANNETTQTLENIYLDNKAPTFTVKESQTVDVTNTLTKRYDFSISDLSGTGRVYYYIDTESIGVTEAYFKFDKSDAETGTTETKNKWAFIPQDADKQSGDTDGAAIIQVENGDSFDGLLYYFAQDDFGNTSGVSTKRISLVNTDLTCTAEDTEIGTYNHYLITLQTPNASGTDIYYQWYDSDGTAVTDEAKYSSAIDTREISGIEDWDGEYTLKCTAKTSESSRETEFSYTFDHTAPTLSVTDSTAGSYSEEHVINITSSDGIGVAELTGQYYRADGTAEGDPFTISSYTDSFSYSVSENLIFAPEKSGAYRLKVTSSDLNGRTTEQTTSLIYIRNAAPEVTLTAETASEYGEYPLVGADGSYSVKVNVNEDFINASNTAVTTTEGQYLYYRIVNDGIAGEWTKLSNPLTASEETTENEDGTTTTSSAFTGEYTIDAPAELIEGENIVMMEFIIAAEGRTGIYADEAVASSDSSDGIENESYRIAHEYFTIFRDTTAPEYVLTLEDERTADDIIGKLTITDTYTDEFTVTPLDSAVTLELIGETAGEEIDDEDITVNEDADIELEDELLEYTNYTVTVSDNVTTSITVTDAAGNSVSVPIEIKKIDREGPTAEMNSYEKNIAVGDRLDASAVITMSDKRMDLDTFELAVIPADELESAVDEDGNISDDYFGDYVRTMTYNKTSESVAANSDEVISVYDVYLAGADGDYYIGVRGEDALGNVNDTVFDEKFTIVDAAAAVSLASVSPKEAGTRALAKISSNVPIYILPQNLITDVPDEDAADDGSGGIDTANLELANNYASSYSQENSMVITKNDTYTLYVCDDLGRTSKLTLTIDESSVTFGNDIDEPTVETYLMTTITGYRVTGKDAGTEDVLEREMELIPDGEYAPAYELWNTLPDDTYYESPDSEHPYYHYTSISESVIKVTAADGTYLQPNDDQDTYYNELTFSDELSADYLTEYGYSAMIYTVDQMWDYDDALEYAYESEQYVRELPVKTCTAEGYALGDYQDMILAVDSIDNTGPKISFTYDPMAFDPNSGEIAYTLGDVTVDVLISDPQSGVEYIDIWGYRYDEGEWSKVISLVDDNGDPIDYMTEPYTYSDEWLDIELYSDTDLKTTKYMRMTIHYNSVYYVTPYNTCGMYGYPEGDDGGYIDVDGINRIELSDSDYTLEYFYEDNNGDWQPADPEDEDTYFRKGKAVITPTDADNSRGLYVSNNGGSWTKELSILEPSYTFVLKDQYGYTLNVDAALKNFDITPGTIEYSFDDTTLTNSAPITITAQDSPSGVGSVTLSHGGVTTTLTETSVDEDGVYTYNETLTSSGTYTITLTDKVGNVTEKIFIVSTIDTVAPELLNVIYSTTKVTSKSVTALLKYTKSNVTLTEVEPVQDGFEDYDVDYANSLIRFYDNGSLTVTFTDAYGNVGYGTVGVSNIYNIPPSLTAVMTPSADTLSVDVTFEKATDSNGAYIDTKRELTDVTVLYGGIARRAQTIDEEGNVTDAKYTFATNGTYTFTVYDDEGVTSYITIEITGIDKSAPQITQVSWSYYYDEYDDTSGEWKTAQLTETWDVGDEEGYVIATDKKPITNYNVDVTVTADSETTISGKTNSESGTEHTLTYSDNGMYIFNLEKPNGTLASYGFDVEVIDKIPPVIELNSEELLFYENPEMGEAYDRDLIDKCFTASDAFLGTVTDLTDKVTIDYGNFDPDDINNNKFDRSIAYTITYSVTDSANNTTEARMTVRLVGLTDTIALVNGLLPNASNQAEVDTKDLTINLKNFSGISYAKIEEGALSMGKMKTSGTVIEEAKDENGDTISGEYQYTVDSNGWYTILVQTDKRDYFNLQIYVWESE